MQEGVWACLESLKNALRALIKPWQSLHIEGTESLEALKYSLRGDARRRGGVQCLKALNKALTKPSSSLDTALI